MNLLSDFDPIIPYLKIGEIDMTSVKLTPNTVKKYDCVIIATDHSKVNYKLILKNARLIYDLRNIYGGQKDKKIRKI